ncbi:hypothetical protein QUA40_26570 [Microcoleus sp. Pol11C3]|uniref:hypothetical protein n=1 Tax=Microcoleus sp. Pol11C3 TaxID=3055390 RepID=UPI002FD0DA64
MEKPATLAVADAMLAHKVLTERSIRQLLSENYKFLNRERPLKHSSSHEPQKTHRVFAFNLFGESELGQYIDRLLAKEIVTIAQKNQAGSRDKTLS